MGVPGYFKALEKKFKRIIKNCLTKRASHLFFDLNCLLHPQCFKVLAIYINETNQDKLFKKMCKRILEFSDYIVRLVNPTETVYYAVDGIAPLAKISQQRDRRFGYANPYKQIIYDKHGVKNNNSWSNIVITPGTEFMHKLHLRLVKHFEQMIANRESGQTFNIIYSSYLTPGEGEHKILQYIKNNCPVRSNYARVIYGLDADLIFLAMASQYDNLYLLREADQLNQARVNEDDPHNVAEELLYVDMDDVKLCVNITLNDEYSQTICPEGIFEDDYDAYDECDSNSDQSGIYDDPLFAGEELDDMLSSNHDSEKGILERSPYSPSDSDTCESNPKSESLSDLSGTSVASPSFKFDFCNDYIFICYFLGNDFLPHLPSVDIKVDGLEMVLQSYITALESRNNMMISFAEGKAEINYEFLRDFVGSLAAKENNYFQSTLPDHLARMRRYRCRETSRHKRDLWNVERLRMSIDGKGNLSRLYIEDPVRLGEGIPADWKYRYYKHYFHTDYRQSELIDKICANYVEGLHWVAQYYFEDCPSWRWQYKYSHAPFLSDVLSYIERYRDKIQNRIEFNRGKPLDMYTQLVSVIPQKYSHILPLNLQKISSSAKSPVIDMFPVDYPLDMIGKTMLYKCVPHIPFLDVSRMEAEISRHKLSRPEIIRSTPAKPFLFEERRSKVKIKTRRKRKTKMKGKKD